MLRPHLTLKNYVSLLAEARYKSKREVEQQIVRLAPKPEVAALVRRLPDQTVISALRRAQDLMRHSQPSGDLAAIIERALEVLIEQLESRQIARTVRPRTSLSESPPPSKTKTGASRYLPAAVRRTVWKRDAGRCAFIGPHGRCTETGRLEFHHIVPFARGGTASASNIALRCRAHNAYEGELFLGRREDGKR